MMKNGLKRDGQRGNGAGGIGSPTRPALTLDLAGQSLR